MYMYVGYGPSLFRDVTRTDVVFSTQEVCTVLYRSAALKTCPGFTFRKELGLAKVTVGM